MRNVRINPKRITPSLLISGVTIVPVYLIFLVLWSVIFEGTAGLEPLYELFTQESKARRIHVFIIFLLTFLVPVFALVYGGAVYWLLSKYYLLSYFTVIFCSIIPAILAGVALREYGITIVLSFFCIWHSSISWWYVRRGECD